MNDLMISKQLGARPLYRVGYAHEKIQAFK